jgi:hypothetical protein
MSENFNTLKQKIRLFPPVIQFIISRVEFIFGHPVDKRCLL